VEPEDAERYQTVYARHDGAVAAPTAGLHFTPSLLAALDARGISAISSRCTSAPAPSCPSRPTTRPSTACTPNGARSPPTPPRPQSRARAPAAASLPSAPPLCGCWRRRPRDDGTIRPFAGETALFITPGYRFKAVDALMTNFHLPRSTLFMLVAAFSGLDTMRAAYAHAIAPAIASIPTAMPACSIPAPRP
jgi:S-adenosylmethionine:tRNA ribosyltransferase-isomerase